MSRAAIEGAIPHRPPFLFIDEVVTQDDKRLVARKTWREDEWFYTGHYPFFPLTPGVLLCESAMQAGAILISGLSDAKVGGVPVAARMNDVRFKRMVRPGETTEIEVELTDRLKDAYYLTAKVTCDNKLAARLDFVCMLNSMQ